MIEAAAEADEIGALGPWHHDIEIAPGVRTGDARYAVKHAPQAGTPTIVDPQRDMVMLFGDVFPAGLEGRSFLDCACNAGGHLFAARSLGAGRVLGFDAREHWIKQARYVAGKLGTNDAEFHVATLESVELRERFDITQFRGIFYHLPDPIAGLKIAADATNELIIVNTASRPRPENGLLLNPESRVAVMSGVDGLAWLPTRPQVVIAALKTFGFPHCRVRFEWQTGPDWGRFEVLGSRKADTFRHFDTIEPEIRRYGTSPRRSFRDRLADIVRS